MEREREVFPFHPDLELPLPRTTFKAIGQDHRRGKGQGVGSTKATIKNTTGQKITSLTKTKTPAD